jgi:hypothetical protein
MKAESHNLQNCAWINADLTAKALVNTYYDSSVNKLYKVNADGTKGAEIQMTPLLDVANKVEITTTAITTTKDGAVGGIINGGNVDVVMNDSICLGHTYNGNMALPIQHGIPSGSTLKLTSNNTSTLKCWFIPYL